MSRHPTSEANRTALREAGEIERMHRDEGQTYAEIASRLGKHPQFVQNRMNLLRLDGEALERFKRGEVGIGGAQHMVSKMSVEERSALYRRLAMRRHITLPALRSELLHLEHGLQQALTAIRAFVDWFEEESQGVPQNDASQPAERPVVVRNVPRSSPVFRKSIPPAHSPARMPKTLLSQSDGTETPAHGRVLEPPVPTPQREPIAISLTDDELGEIFNDLTYLFPSPKLARRRVDLGVLHFQKRLELEGIDLSKKQVIARGNRALALLRERFASVPTNGAPETERKIAAYIKNIKTAFGATTLEQLVAAILKKNEGTGEQIDIDEVL